MWAYCVVAAALRIFLPYASAAPVQYISDTISASAPIATSTHTVRFTVVTSVPPSGTITVTPAAGQFSVPAGLDYTDIDLATATSGPYADRSLAATAGVAEDGVSVVSGASGSLTITLNSAQGLSVGERVLLEVGSNADYGAIGDQNITNPSAAGSYTVDVLLKDSSGGVVGSGRTMVAVVFPVLVGATPEYIPPIRVNGLPSGEIAAGNDMIELSLNTDVLATCRYATTSAVAYADMVGAFQGTFSMLHTAVLTDFADNTAYNFYVRCMNVYSIYNLDDYAISFTLKASPPAPGGGSGGGGSGPITRGAQTLYRSAITLSGKAYPGSSITVLSGAEKIETVSANGSGSFTVTVNNLERGVHTFAIYATDRVGLRSSAYSASVMLGQGVQSTVSDILIPPTIALEKTAVEPGISVAVSGTSIPGGTVEVAAAHQIGKGFLGDTFSVTASSSPSGVWSAELDTKNLSAGTYEINARSRPTQNVASRSSSPVYLGVGAEPSPDLTRKTDMNGDAKINLVDFSILLTHWNTSNTTADINGDGTVNLADFSILLFNWTG